MQGVLQEPPEYKIPLRGGTRKKFITCIMNVEQYKRLSLDPPQPAQKIVRIDGKIFSPSEGGKPSYEAIHRGATNLKDCAKTLWRILIESGKRNTQGLKDSGLKTVGEHYYCPEHVNRAEQILRDKTSQ
jgi:hypothetical protein